MLFVAGNIIGRLERLGQLDIRDRADPGKLPLHFAFCFGKFVRLQKARGGVLQRRQHRRRRAMSQLGVAGNAVDEVPVQQRVHILERGCRAGFIGIVHRTDGLRRQQRLARVRHRLRRPKLSQSQSVLAAGRGRWVLGHLSAIQVVSCGLSGPQMQPPGEGACRRQNNACTDRPFCIEIVLHSCFFLVR